MGDIVVERRHRLDPSQAREAVEGVAQELKQELGGTYQWEGEQLHFSRSGARGQIELEENSIRVVITLSRLMRPMRRRVHSVVEQYLDERLAALH